MRSLYIIALYVCVIIIAVLGFAISDGNKTVAFWILGLGWVAILAAFGINILRLMDQNEQEHYKHFYRSD